MSRQKQLSVVFDVANAQKQGVADAEWTEAEDTTMFQELVKSTKCRVNAEWRMQNCEGELYERRRGTIGGREEKRK